MTIIKTFFIIILLYPLLTFGQDPNNPNSISISYGDNHEDFISELGEVDQYHFDAEQGDVIMLRMRDETKVDAFIKIYDPDGVMIGSAWSDGGLAKIKDLKIEKHGKFIILAYDRNHNDIGKYGISLHKLNDNSYAKSIPEIVSFEDDIKEIVGVNMYKFSAEKGDILFTQMRALTVHLECEFYIYSSSGEEVYKSLNTGRLATVGPVKIAKDDDYKIVVTDRGGNDKDTYGMTHMLLNKHNTVPVLGCGDNVQSKLNYLVERHPFRLEAKAGQIPLIEARSNNNVLETSMEIYDEKGELVFKQSRTNKLISSLLPASDHDKSYLIVVYDRNGNDLGEFGLQVQFLDNSFCPSVLSCESQKDLINIDGLAQSKLFSVQGIEGQSIEITLKETDPILEPHLRVYNLYGEMIAEKFDGVKAKLGGFTFPYSGKFLVLASDRSGNDIGQFEITAPPSDMGLEITGCQTVYKGFDPMANATVSAGATGEDLQYLWSNNETTPSIQVSPLESTTYTVTVTNSAGCSGITSTFVEVVDVNCGNGNAEQKVEACHVKNNGQHQTLCISIDGVWEHLNNGNGHEECHIGPCNHISECDEEGLTIEDEVAQRSLMNKWTDILVYPNPSADKIYLNLGMIESEKVTFTLLNTAGQRVYKELAKNIGQTIEFSFNRSKLPQGMYFISLEGDNYQKTKQVIYLK